MVIDNPKVYFVIVAAGSGSRFGSTLPKQFLTLDGKPVLLHSIETVQQELPQAQIILVLSESGREIWEDMARRYNFPAPAVVLGGAQRTDSVRNALDACRNLGCNNHDIIMVHDGARPLVSANLIKNLYKAVRDFEGVVPAISLTDSIVKVEQDGTGRGVDRSKYRAVQTPQAFRSGILMEAYNAALPSSQAFTDDASVVEAYTGNGTHIIDGENTNIKITNPADLKIAEIILRHSEH
ncbi:MAG: 2-C-methyl-D-erythritol 4-phosphate cytidylyltransferase [Bacteroidales bacterium]|nr:2-C-methyl-D-erythritol 4-phosphate cytidylyltransferase [Bacteroidales bacterium]